MRLYRDGLEDVQWQIPSLFNNDFAALVFLETIEKTFEEPPKVNISSTFGSMKSSWNSGRPASAGFSMENFSYFVNYYNSKGISCALTFSNHSLTESDLESPPENWQLNYLNNVDNGVDNYVILSSDLLYDLLVSEYPNVKLESSVLKPVYEHPMYDERPDYYNALAERFDKVVVRPEFLNNDNFMQALVPKDRFILLVNQTCVPYCEKAGKHYDFYSGNASRTPQCDQVYLDSCSVDYYRIRELIDMGFSSFKLQGRNVTAFDFLTMLGTYVFEPTGDIQTILSYARKKMNSAYNV